jgi:hypothetical protein
MATIINSVVVNEEIGLRKEDLMSATSTERLKPCTH